MTDVTSADLDLNYLSHSLEGFREGREGEREREREERDRECKRISDNKKNC